MRTCVKIAVVLSVLVASVACTPRRGYRADDEAVARVGSAYLYRSELAAMMPNGVVAADSVSCSNAIISKWIVSQLKQLEAEKLFAESNREIDRLVEEYRRSLLVNRLDRHYIESEPCGEISEKRIADYYNTHKADFLVKQPMVKGEIVAMKESYRRRTQMAERFKSSTGESRKDFVEMCRKDKLPYLQFEEWTPFSDYCSNLPLLRNANHDDMLASRSTQQIHHDRMYYYYRITEVLKVGDAMPLEMAKESIRQILTNAHNAEVVARHEEEIKAKALSMGEAEIYKED